MIYFRLSFLLAAMPYLLVSAAPINGAGNGMLKRSTDTDNLVLSVVSVNERDNNDVDNIPFLIAAQQDKRGTDTDNLVLSAVSADKRDTDTDNLVRLVASVNDKRDTDTDNLVRLVASANEKRGTNDVDNIPFIVAAQQDKRETDTDNLVRLVASSKKLRAEKRADMHANESRKVKSPYTDDIEKADRVAVLGD